jgi:hypothetical protein
MYTKEQVDDMLSQVEREFEKTLGSIVKSEKVEEQAEEIVEEEQSLEKSEESEEEVEYTEEDYKTVDDLYGSMSKSEIEAHYSSIKRVMFGDESEEKSEDMAKSEDSVKETDMIKAEISTVKAENEELKKSVETMTELLNKLFNSGKKAPTQKAITGIDYIAKSEESETGSKGLDISKMSKSEITSKLKSVNYAELSKSDRECINDFYLNNGSVEKIKHLIKE